MSAANAGVVYARQLFERRGNNSEIHLKEVELAAVLQKAVDDVRFGYLKAAQQHLDEGIARFAKSRKLLREVAEGLLALTPVWPDDEGNEHAQAEVHAERLGKLIEKATRALEAVKRDEKELTT